MRAQWTLRAREERRWCMKARAALAGMTFISEEFSIEEVR